MSRVICALALTLSFAALSADAPPTVVIATSAGDIEVELNPEKAPETVKNFLAYVDAKFYDGTIFHRVIPNFMIQGGGFTSDMKPKETKAPVKNENGTIAMARTFIVDSATSQFFINVKDNGFLDHRDETPQGFGYCVFGKVTKGMDVVKKIETTPTGVKGGMPDVPTAEVTIKSITLAPKK